MTEDRWEAFGDYDDDRKFNEGIMAERERIIALLNNDEVMHNIWWLIKREEYYPSQEFIAEVIRDELELINGEN